MNFERAKQILEKRLGKEYTIDIDLINSSIENLHLSRGSRILDIGTGWGIMSIILAVNGFDVITGSPEKDGTNIHSGNDHCDEHEHHSIPDFNWKENAKAVGVEKKISFRHLNAEKLPFSSKSFNAIFMYDILQHIHNRKLAVDESVRVIRPGGIICIIELNDAGTKAARKEWGFEAELIDPRKYLSDIDFDLDLIEGKYFDAFLLKNRI